VHLGSDVAAAVRADAAGRKRRCLAEAASAMAEATIAGWKRWQG